MAWPLALSPILRQVNKTTLALQGFRENQRVEAQIKEPSPKVPGDTLLVRKENVEVLPCAEPVKCLALKQMGWGLWGVSLLDYQVQGLVLLSTKIQTRSALWRNTGPWVTVLYVSSPECVGGRPEARTHS